MNIRLKLVLSAAALAAGCVLLAGCGGSASSASSSASSAASSEAASPSASEPTASVSAEENGASDAVASAVTTQKVQRFLIEHANITSVVEGE